MSHNTYKKKLWLETSKGDLLPLAYYADSSIRDEHGKYVYSWCVYNFRKGILINKDLFRQMAEEVYQEEIDKLTDYRLKCRTDESFEPAGSESYCYYGNVYPGGGKMKHMRAFHSVRNTVPIQKFLSEHPCFNINVSAYNSSDYHTVELTNIHITSESDAYRAQAAYDEMRNRHPECGMCFGVYGLD